MRIHFASPVFPQVDVISNNSHETSDNCFPNPADWLRNTKKNGGIKILSLSFPTSVMPPSQDISRLTSEVHHVTQGYRLMLWNFTLLVPIFNRLKEARELNKMVQESIPPLLAFFCGSCRTRLDPTPNPSCYTGRICGTIEGTQHGGHFITCFTMDNGSATPGGGVSRLFHTG